MDGDLTIADHNIQRESTLRIKDYRPTITSATRFASRLRSLTAESSQSLDTATPTSGLQSLHSCVQPESAHPDTAELPAKTHSCARPEPGHGDAVSSISFASSTSLADDDGSDSDIIHVDDVFAPEEGLEKTSAGEARAAVEPEDEPKQAVAASVQEQVAGEGAHTSEEEKAKDEDAPMSDDESDESELSVGQCVLVVESRSRRNQTGRIVEVTDDGWWAVRHEDGEVREYQHFRLARAEPTSEGSE